MRADARASARGRGLDGTPGRWCTSRAPARRRAVAGAGHQRRIASCAAPGVKAVVIVPLGFVSDHMEVLWDLDTEAMETARSIGLAAVRVPTPGVHRAFVSGLVDLVLRAAETASRSPSAGA